MTSTNDIEFSITLRLSGPDLDPASVTAHLNVAPTTTYRKGDVVGAHGGARHKRREVGFWCLSNDHVARDNLSHALLKFLGQFPVSLFAQAPITEFYRDLWISSTTMREWNNGFHLDVEGLQAAASRHLPIVFDLYLSDEATT
jgi:hypothetical protein